MLCCFLGALFGLDAFPAAFDFGRIARGTVCEDVRMAADHLLRDGFDDVAESERALLLGKPGVIDNLKQQVAKLVLQIDQVAARNGIGNLIGFLDRVGRDRREGLLEIPWAAGHRRPERRHDFDKTRDVARRCQCLCHVRPLRLARTLDDGGGIDEGRRCGYRANALATSRGLASTKASGAIQPIQAESA